MAVRAQESTRTAAAGSLVSGQRFRTRIGHLLLHAVLIAFGFIFVVPFLWMIVTSLKVSGTEFTYPPQWIPHPIVWGNYRQALVDVVPFLTYFKNTAIVAAGVTIGDLLTASMAAYSFARLRFPGRNILFMGTLATLMLPNIVTIIPTFLLMRYLHWIDTLLPLIVPSWAGGSAFSIFLFRQFFMTIPLELDEAARMDGANPLRIWWNVIMPLSGTVIATVAIFDVLNSWNDFFTPLIFLNTPGNFTMSLGLGQYVVDHGGQYYNLQMAAATVMTIPVMLLFFFAQRYFMRGIVTSGLAGH